MKSKLNKSVTTGALCILFAVWIIMETGKINSNLISNEPGPRLFPYISAIGIIICSLLSMVFDGKKQTKVTERKPYLDKAGWIRLVLILSELFVFGFGIEWLGFLITSIIMMIVIIWTLKGDKKINTIIGVGLAIGLSMLVYFGFTKGFMIPLPTGKLWEMLGITLPF
ncbi:tripartite tricarboxylate transporter TctB family protein [Lachnotalea glycerini]|nr:tripartite tricarboxylate transporter TctB family protein [Lachnotalea glycerini]